MCGAAAGVLIAAAGTAHAQDERTFNIPAQPLLSALYEFGEQSGRQVLFKPSLADDKTSAGIAGARDQGQALAQLLQGTGLTFRRSGDVYLIVEEGEGAGPQSGSAAGDGADGTVDALIVTAQKREEDIQDVPIAISAFTQETLERSQVAGGPDLMTQVPNMTFTKTNFSSYSIQLRGIGTQAISATTDAAVAVAFNNTPFIRNRFFEQEFYDLQRVEVLRGPQGTLYGRNATAGVVNIISAKPTFNYEAKLSGDVANYSSTRLEGMVNIPLVEDAAALRLAGAWTKREGYSTNQITGNPIDGRDLWSTRLSLRVAPTDTIDLHLVWEHFEEDDDRLRSGKQLCKTHEVTQVGGFPTSHFQGFDGGDGGQEIHAGIQPTFSQGCAPNSLYAADSFQTPNGLALPYYVPLAAVFLPIALDDPYVSRGQSRDLRVIESTVDPEYRAKSDVAELQLNIDLTDTLTLTSETAYSADTVFSMQDFNRFNTAPGAWTDEINPNLGNGYRENVLNDGVFCDPQIGCSDRLVALDVSTADSRQFSQELRLSSSYDGPFNFSLGANYLRYDTEDKYYVFINSLGLIAALSPYGHNDQLSPYEPGVTDNRECLPKGAPLPPDPTKILEVTYCTYMDPNPIGSLNDLGHNYFLSRNPYKLISYAVFGEAYYQVTEALKLTAGLRWTVDQKEAPRIPSWLLASNTVGDVVTEVVRQEWREPTGRLAIDWKPDLAFTDETLLYASYAHGYKAGGANPPPAGPVVYGGGVGGVAAAAIAYSATHPRTFEPEFVDAFELGAKNTLLDGRVTLNMAAFYYDYEGYQISQIVNRSAVNLNFDTKVWGLEIEADWRPLENLRLGFKGGFERTRVADGMSAVDLMDRTAGHDDWIVVKPFPTFSSNCILPVSLFVGEIFDDFGAPIGPGLVNLGAVGGGHPGGCELAYLLGRDPITNLPYVLDPTVGGSLSKLGNHPGYAGWDPSTAPNHGAGFSKDLSGNELPNAPDFTATITADYTLPLPADWLMTLHTDLYYQSEAWTRIFNTEGYDKLKAYTNINLAAIFTNDEAGWKVMAYVKNVFDRDSITGAFLNSDDTALTTNVFLTEPRLFGLRVTKDWTGGPWLTGLGRSDAAGPYPFNVELGGGPARLDAPNEAFDAAFLDAFSSRIDPRGFQSEDLDWGDGREVKLTFAPSAGWRASLGARWGRANHGGRLLKTEPGDKGCAIALATCEYLVSIGYYNPIMYADPENWSETFLYEREAHTIVDFAIGRDAGLGWLGGDGSSAVQVGLRHARLEGETSQSIGGAPDWDVPEEFTLFVNSQHHLYSSTFDARREFEGVGPVLSWEAFEPLTPADMLGKLGVEWSVSGGVLFGKQETSVASQIEGLFYDQLYMGSPPYVPAEVDPVIEFSDRRSRSVTAPVAGASLGVVYERQRVRIGAGYRWERYFDVLDGGVEEARDFDRTIDGPYFKLSVGFGG